MKQVINHLLQALKNARKVRNLSQRDLSLKTGMTQAQISKIENAAADPKLSSVIELSRSLDLELMLIPRQQVTAVTGLINLSASDNSLSDSARPAYSLDDGDGDD